MTKYIVAELIYFKNYPNNNKETVYMKDGDWYVNKYNWTRHGTFEDFSSAKDEVCELQKGEKDFNDIIRFFIVFDENSKKILYPNDIPKQFIRLKINMNKDPGKI